MTGTPIRVGVIGCGEIAQLMHLPFLSELDDFTITAVCDLSPTLAASLRERYRVPRAYTEGAKLIADPNVDAVIVCTYDHADLAAAVLHADKHLLIEKPVAFTSAEAQSIAQAAEKTTAVSMVGYMKLYDPGFERALQIIADAGTVRARTVQNLAGRLDRYANLYGLTRAADIDAGTLASGRDAVDVRVREHLGTHAKWSGLYLLVLGLASHDLAVLRAVFGTPTCVRHAHATGDDNLLAVLEYPDGVPCVLRVGIGTSYEWWDEWVGIDTDYANIRVDFGHPYIKYAPTTISTRDSRSGSDRRSIETVSHASPFRLELEHFAAAIRGRAKVRSPISGGVADLQLATDIIRALPIDNPEPRRT